MLRWIVGVGWVKCGGWDGCGCVGVNRPKCRGDDVCMGGETGE